MAEEAQATPDVNNADTAESVVEAVAEQTATEQSSSPKTKAAAQTEVEEPTEGTDTEGDTESEAGNSDDEDQADETETDKAKKGAEARKEQLNQEIRDLTHRRNDLRKEVETVNSRVYRASTPQELVDQGVDPAMAEVQALKERQAMSDFNNHVSDLNASLNTEALQVMHDFPVFDPDSPEYDSSLATMAQQAYERAAGIQKDPRTGLIIQTNVLPYDIFKAFADAYTAGGAKGRVSGQKATEKMMAAAEIPPASAPKTTKTDPFLVGLLGKKS